MVLLTGSKKFLKTLRLKDLQWDFFIKFHITQVFWPQRVANCVFPSSFRSRRLPPDGLNLHDCFVGDSTFWNALFFAHVNSLLLLSLHQVKLITGRLKMPFYAVALAFQEWVTCFYERPPPLYPLVCRTILKLFALQWKNWLIVSSTISSGNQPTFHGGLGLRTAAKWHRAASGASRNETVPMCGAFLNYH